MDTVTHGIVGALLGKAFFAGEAPAKGPRWFARPRDRGRAAIVCATLGAMFPDLDVFESYFSGDNLAFLTHHRGVTHSLLMLVVWAAGLALLARWLARLIGWPSPDFAQLFSIFAAAITSHIFLDLLTSWGTMVWAPADHSRLAWDVLFIIDVWLTSAALVPQLAAWAHRDPRRSLWMAPLAWAGLSAALFALAPWARSLEVPLSNQAAAGASVVFGIFLLLPLRHRGRSHLGRVTWSRIGMVLVTGYIGFAAGMHYVALREVRQFAEQNGIDYAEAAAIPLPPWPGRWAGLIATNRNTYRVQFDLLGTETPRIDIFRDAAPNQYVEQARQLPGVQKFLWFARFPMFTYLERDGQPVVQISDLRFVGPRRPGAVSGARNPGANFTYEVVFSSRGTVRSSGLAIEN